jgi:hypothetical protein
LDAQIIHRALAIYGLGFHQPELRPARAAYLLKDFCKSAGLD